MKFIISHLNFYKSSSKQEKYKLDLFEMIKPCLYLILISPEIYCAESSDFVSIDKESKLMESKDQIKIVNELTKELTLGSKNSESPKNTNSEFRSKLKEKEVPSTSETDSSNLKTDLFEFKIFSLQLKLNSIQEHTIPNVIKDFEEDKELQNKVCDLIVKIKSNGKSYDKNLIEKIEEKMKVQKNQNSKFNEVIQGIITETKSHTLLFEKFKNEFYETMKFQSSTVLQKLMIYISVSLANIDSESEQLHKGLALSKLCFFKKKNNINTILMILTKVLELTFEEFKKDEEVSKAVLSLN